ncbi:MAG: TIGR03435 family protein [Vicinamibacterales bacterium]
MKRHERKIEDVLKRLLPSAPRGEMEPALDRVHARLRADRYVSPHEPEARIEAAPVAASWRLAMRAAAAAIVVAAAVWTGVSLRDQDVYAVLEAADGSRYRIAAQETIRSSDAAGALLSLADGSHVEIRSQSELSWDHAADGTTIRLDAGSIIVSAAKPSRGQLYVETKDMTIASLTPAQDVKADGATFLVNTAGDGSRVAVINGEARVREATGETRLRAGEEVSTSRTLSARPVTEEISWSRNAEAHLAVLASFMKGIATTSGPLTPLDGTSSALQAPAAQGGAAATQGARFEEASVRECDPDNLPSSPIGARGGGANSLLMTPGRLYVQCVTFATLIRTAYEYGPVELEFRSGNERGRRREGGMRLEAVYGLGVEDGERVRGGPDWIRDVRYTLEAVGDPQATAAMMRAPMLRDLLERRFQLRVHIESEQIPAYALVVGPGGLKGMKPFRESDCGGEVSDAVKAERARKGWRGPVLITEAAYFGIKPSCGGVYGETNGPNYHFEVVNSTPGIVAGSIGGSMGVRVIDRTNITDRFTFTWDFGIDEQTPRAIEDLKRGKTWNPRPGWDSPMTIPKAPSIFAAVEQLGLKLEPIRVPREFIVVDRVQRPSPN